MKSTTKLLAFTLFTLMLSACGGGGSANAPSVSGDQAISPSEVIIESNESNFFAQGIYDVTLMDPNGVVGGSSGKLTVMVGDDGTIAAYNRLYGDVYYGAASPSGAASATGVLHGIAGPGYYFLESGDKTISLAASITQHPRYDGMYDGVTSYNGSVVNRLFFESETRPIDNKDQYDFPHNSFSDAAGDYSAIINHVSVFISISETGQLSGSDAVGCRYQGQLSQYTPEKNLYALSVTVTYCGIENGVYNGKAFFSRGQATEKFVFAAYNNQNGRGGALFRR